MSSPQTRKRGQRSAFLRRGDVTPTTRLSSSAATPATAKATAATSPTIVPPSPLPPPGEASLVLTEEDMAGHDPAPTLSPQPSQFTQPTQHLSRQRPRFHTVQDLDLALNQAIEGKINTKNAWVSREASDLLEGIAHTIQSTLEAHDQTNDYSGFAKAATVVEGCSKVWTVRVDSTYNQSNQMLQRLLRNDESAASSGGPQEGAEPASPLGLAGDEAGTQDGGSSAATRSRGRAALARTLAMEASEINLDERALSSLTQVGIKAEFRAITEKFDQGNAQGLLLNNAPLGAAGNLILDVDYARLATAQAKDKAATMTTTRPSAASNDEASRPASVRGSVKPEPVSAWADDATEEAGQEPPPPSRRSTSAAEADRAMDIDAVLADLPPYEPTAVALADLTEATGATAGDGRASTAALLLLVGPGLAPAGEATSRAHEGTAPADEEKAGESGPVAGPIAPRDEPPAETRLSNGMAAPGTRATTSEAAGLLTAAGAPPQRQTEEEDDGAWYEDDGAMPEDDAGDSVAEVEAEGACAAHDNVLDAARALVSGAAELNAMDRGFYTGAQLALEADDPAAWCPLSATTASAFGAVAPRSELTRLHKEHRLGPQPPASPAATAKTGTEEAMSGGEVGAARRPRKERTVVFELPDDLTGGGGGLDFSKAALAQSALKQSATLTKNVTPLGREILLSAHAAQAVQPFLQGAVQRAKAEHAGLLLPDTPVPGEHIPAYLPYPIDIPCFFQPFATSVSRWNLLRKSVSGALLGRDGRGYLPRQDDAATRAGDDGEDAVHRGSGTSNGGSERAGGAAHGEDAMGDMPVEFIPGGAEEAEDDDMGADYGTDEEGHLAAGAEARASEHALLAQFAALHQSHLASSSASPRQTTSLLPHLANADLSVDELVDVLRSADVTMPSQVDVVRLRQTMWEVVQAHLGLRGKETATPLQLAAQTGSNTAGTQAQHDEPQDRAAGGVSAATTQTAVARGPLMKRHVSLVMARARERREAALAASHQQQQQQQKQPDDEHEDAKAKEPAADRADDKDAKLTRKRTRAELEAEGSSSSRSDSGSDSDETRTEAATLKFSDVVRDMLAAVPAISSSGTLSPAFFFFSILFLANEHNVVLESVATLDDLTIKGVVRGLTQEA